MCRGIVKLLCPPTCNCNCHSRCRHQRSQKKIRQPLKSHPSVSVRDSKYHKKIKNPKHQNSLSLSPLCLNRSNRRRSPLDNRRKAHRIIRLLLKLLCWTTHLLEHRIDANPIAVVVYVVVVVPASRRRRRRRRRERERAVVLKKD